MASKRAIRRRPCKSKVRYPDQGAAQAGISRINRMKGYQGFMTAYHCGFCGGWHFGHPPARVRRAIAEEFA